MATGTPMTFDGDATPDAVIAEMSCSEVLWREPAASTDVEVYEPYANSPKFTIGAGESYSFKVEGRKYREGETVGYVKAVTAGTYTGHRKYIP